MNKEVLVVIGAGGMGQAIAHRLGSGKAVLLADFSKDTLDTAADAMRGSRYDVTTYLVDVSSPESVAGLAEAAQARGSVTQGAHLRDSPRHARPPR